LLLFTGVKNGLYPVQESKFQGAEKYDKKIEEGRRTWCRIQGGGEEYVKSVSQQTQRKI